MSRAYCEFGPSCPSPNILNLAPPPDILNLAPHPNILNLPTPMDMHYIFALNSHISQLVTKIEDYVTHLRYIPWNSIRHRKEDMLFICCSPWTSVRHRKESISCYQFIIFHRTVFVIEKKTCEPICVIFHGTVFMIGENTCYQFPLYSNERP